MPIGGAQSIGRFLNLFGPQGLDVRLAGLCDAGEERDFRRGLERAGLGSDLTRAEMESLGFYVCVADLEDELIRALGAASVEQIIAAQGELRIRSAPSRSSLRRKDGPSRSSFGASWAPAAGERSNTLVCSSTGSTSIECLGRSIWCSPTSELGDSRSCRRYRGAGFSQTETCRVLSLVNGSRAQPLQRSRSLMPASRAIRSSSEGHTYRKGIDLSSNAPPTAVKW